MCGSWVQRDMQARDRRRLGNVFKRWEWRGRWGGADLEAIFVPLLSVHPSPSSPSTPVQAHRETGLHPQEQRLVSAHISAPFSCLLGTALPNLGMTSDLSVQGWAGDPAGPAPSHSQTDTEGPSLLSKAPRLP